MPRFCTAPLGGQTCYARALPGKRFCSGHDPDHVRFRPCSYATTEGTPCRAMALRGQNHCFAHSPRNFHRRYPAVRRAPGDFDPTAFTQQLLSTLSRSAAAKR